MELYKKAFIQITNIFGQAQACPWLDIQQNDKHLAVEALLKRQSTCGLTSLANRTHLP